MVRARLDGPAELAIEAASRLLALDPTNEQAHRALMQFHARSGRRDLALRQYEKCRAALKAELGIEPDAPTLALFEDISTTPAPTADASVPDEGSASERAAIPESASLREPTSAAAALGERRQITVMACGLLMPTARELDPEDHREVVQSVLDVCSEVVRRYNGHVAKFVGDGFLAYFGYPRAHEDDAERSVHAGLGIVEALQTHPNPTQAGILPRVGIATGQVVVDEVADGDGGQTQAVSGQAPSLAARLQQLAQAGSIVVGERTHRLLGSWHEACGHRR